MTTPAINTPYGVIKDALVDCGHLQEGQDPGSDQLANGLRRLRDLINFWNTKGLKLFLQQDVPIPLTAGTADYTLGPAGSVVMVRPLKVIYGYYLFTATNVRRPLTPMSQIDYLQLGKAGTLTSDRGTVTQYFVHKRATDLLLTLWQTPDTTEAANGQVHVLVQGQATNPIELDETMSFPEEWRMALRWGLADDWSTGQPQSIVERCAMKAEQYRVALEDWDVEDSDVKFQANTMGYSDNSFS